MKKLGFLLCLISFWVGAQELDSLAADTVEKVPPAYYLGVYADAGLGLVPSAPNHNFVGSYGVGVQYNRWFLEATVADQLGSYEYFLVFPNVFSFKYRYGGFQASYNLIDKNLVDIRIGMGYYLGDMLWKYRDSDEDFLRDKFRMYSAFAILEFGKIRYIKPYISFGYQLVQDVALPNISAGDFTGLQGKVGVRLGFFNQ